MTGTPAPEQHDPQAPAGAPPYYPQPVQPDPWQLLAQRAFPSGLSQLLAAGLPPSLVALLGVWFLYAQLQTLSGSVADLRSDVQSMSQELTRMSANAWTRADHDAYDNKIDTRLREIERRLSRAEARSGVHDADDER